MTGCRRPPQGFNALPGVLFRRRQGRQDSCSLPKRRADGLGTSLPGRLERRHAALLDVTHSRWFQAAKAPGLHDAQNASPQNSASQPQTAGGCDPAKPKPFKAPMLHRRQKQMPSISQPDVAKSLWFPLTDTLQRTVIIPNGFDTAQQYHLSFARALREEINLR